MRRNISKPWLIAMAGCLLCLVQGMSAFADAKADLLISPKGACAGGGTSFVITNNNTKSSIHATVTQSTRNAGNITVTTIDMSFLAGETKTLGCSTQTAAGNFLVIWQVQSAQYQ
jgi:dihydroorotase-like cyclic amidohydrolase